MRTLQLPLTRIELDRPTPCGIPGCKCENMPQVYFHQRCHPSAPTSTFYDKATGCVIVECAACKKLCARIKVASTLLDV